MNDIGNKKDAASPSDQATSGGGHRRGGRYGLQLMRRAFRRNRIPIPHGKRSKAASRCRRSGEWTRAGYRAPACYVTNARPIVHATFSAAPADLSRWVEPPSGNFGYFEQYPIPSSIANTISTNDLPTNTVFRPEPQSLFSPVQTNTEINTRLAKAIPALSGGVGASPLLSIFGQSHSYDMQQPGNPTAFPNGRITHSPYGTAFRHSDVKGLSYYHCFNIWRQLASDLAEGLEE